MTEQFRFVLVRETHLVDNGMLYALARALERHARACALAWGLLPPTVDVVDQEERVSGLYHPIRFQSHTENDPGALAVHYFDPIRNGPAAIVYVDRGSGFNVGRQSVAEAAAHEVTEALCNPRLNIWLPHPNPLRPGVQVAREVDDPTQAHYEFRLDGENWQMSSFVLPAWFGGNTQSSGERYDHAGTLSYPGEVGPEGYVILRERRGDRWRIWFEDASGQAFGSVPPKGAGAVRALSPSSRSKLLLQQASASAE